MPQQSAPLSYGLDASACAAFRRDGLFCPVDVMPPDEATALRRRIEAVEARSHGRLSGLARTKPHLLMPFLWDIVHDARILDRIESLLGHNLYCIGSSIIDKPTGSDGYVAWHQDATFWGLSEAAGATAWLALSPATLEAGCMQAVPGTHTHQLEHLDTGDARNMLGAREKVRQTVDPSEAVTMALHTGQMSLHHPQVVHGSGPNTSGDRRLGFVIRYVPAHVRQEGGTVTLVRGNNLAHMPLEIAPEGEMHPDALARHGNIIRLGGQVVRQAKQAHLAAATHRQDGGE